MTELRELIRKVSSQYPNASSGELARHVAKLTPADVLLEYYEEALRPQVAEVLRLDRNEAITNALSDSPHPLPQQPRRSKKVAGIANWWAKMLEQIIPLADGPKKLGDATVEDLNFAIDRRKAQIEQDKIKVAEFEQLRDWMLTHNATTLREAPPMTA